jgi:rhombotail lipoprotein
MKRIILLICVISLSSCALFGEYRERHVQSTSLVGFLYPKGKVPLIDKPNPVLNLPLKVGLAFIPDNSNQTTITLATKNELLENVKRAFSGRQYVDEIIIIPEIYLQGVGGYDTLEQVNNLYQLDVIALVSYDQIVNGRDNLLSLSYLTIVGAYILPGSGYDVSTMIDLAVIDVPSRSILFRSAGTNLLDKNLVPGAYANQAYLKKQNKGFTLAMQQMQANLYLELDKFEKRLRKRDPQDKIQVRHRQGYSGGSVSTLMLGLLLVVGLVKIKRRALVKIKT